MITPNSPCPGCWCRAGKYAPARRHYRSWCLLPRKTHERQLPSVLRRSGPKRRPDRTARRLSTVWFCLFFAFAWRPPSSLKATSLPRSSHVINEKMRIPVPCRATETVTSTRLPRQQPDGVAAFGLSGASLSRGSCPEELTAGVDGAAEDFRISHPGAIAIIAFIAKATELPSFQARNTKPSESM